MSIRHADDPHSRRRNYWRTFTRMALRLRWAVMAYAWLGWIDRSGRWGRHIARHMGELEHGVRCLLVLMRRKAATGATPFGRRCQRRPVSTPQASDTGSLPAQEHGFQPALEPADVAGATHSSEFHLALTTRFPREGGDPGLGDDGSRYSSKRRFSLTLIAFDETSRPPPPIPGCAGNSPVNRGREDRDRLSAAGDGGRLASSLALPARRRPSPAQALIARMNALMDVLADAEPHAVRMARALRRAGLGVRALVVRPANDGPDARRRPAALARRHGPPPALHDSS